MRVVLHESAGAFLSRASTWLMRSEAENNLIIGIATNAAQSGDSPAGSMFATAESDDSVVGCAFRTPPFKLGLSKMPLKAIPQLADAVGGLYDSLPGVLGPHEEARYFSRMWCGPRALSFRPAMDQRIYALEELIEPDETPDGAMRAAIEDDEELVVEWLRRFFEETHMPVSNAEDVTRRLLPDGSMSLWVVDGTEVAMAGISGRTPNGARIGFVYTPPEHRKNGYGTAITAALTRQMLHAGKQHCFLFTDASNPATNRLYQTLGYRPVADVVDYQFF